MVTTQDPNDQWDPHVSDEWEWWFGGYRWSERRPLYPAEREAAESIVSEERKRAMAWRGFLALVLVVSLTIAFGQESFAGGVGVLITGVVWVWFEASHYSQLDRFRGDLARGIVDVMTLEIPSDNPLKGNPRTILVGLYSGKLLLSERETSSVAFGPRRVGLCPAKGDEQPRVPSQTEAQEIRQFGRAWAVWGTICFATALVFVAWFTVYLIIKDGHSWGLLANSVMASIAIIRGFRGTSARLRIHKAMHAPVCLETKTRDETAYECVAGTDVPWTINGYPAAWRRSPRVRFDYSDPIKESWRLT